ncbi:MAG: hypothetical protein EBT94_09355, partial [Alphaproteobacteria bacterium]|nr:hypothetical protein [Alphaproteobacteria bacterium]
SKIAFDLHVLGMPPAFVLSQDQTLRLDWFNGLLRELSPPNLIHVHLLHIEVSVQRSIGLTLLFTKDDTFTRTATRESLPNDLTISNSDQAVGDKR